MKSRPAPRLVLGWLVALATSSCLAPPWAANRGPCPVGLVATDDLPRDLRLRSRMRLDFDDQQLHLEIIVDRARDGIVVVGLAPYGIRLFAVHQRARDVDVESPVRELERVAVWVLDALHRVHWIDAVMSTSSNPWLWSREGEQVTDWRQGGRLLRREFAWTTRAPADTVVSIDYAPSDGRAPETGIRVRNPWCGYEALLVTQEPSASKPMRDPDGP